LFADIVPADDKSECLTLMNQYGRSLLDAIINDIPFGAICTGVKVCTNGLKKVRGWGLFFFFFLTCSCPRILIQAAITECQVCQLVMQDVDAALEDTSIQNEIIAEMDSVCAELGPLHGACQALLKVRGW
jgi:hypothetical protein